MFPLLLSVSQSLPLPLIVHPALFIEHWNCITTITETVCMDTCITPQKRKQRQCVVFVVIPAVPALFNFQ